MASPATTQVDGGLASMDLTPELVNRVGAAAAKVARIQQDYEVQAEAEPANDARQEMAHKARADAERVLGEHGLTIDDYNTVLTAAETDRALEQRLLEAARAVL
jgi:hypothetical protein